MTYLNIKYYFHIDGTDVAYSVRSNASLHQINMKLIPSYKITLCTSTSNTSNNQGHDNET